MPDSPKSEYRSVTCVATHERGSKAWLIEEGDLSKWWVMQVSEGYESALLDARYTERFKPEEFGRVLSAQAGSLTAEQKKTMQDLGTIPGLQTPGWRLTGQGESFVGHGRR